MNLQGRNLSLRIRGDDVQKLHIELRKLGYTISTQEYGQRNFGPVTHKAVLDFQRRHNLPENGVVDEATAKRINEAADALTLAAEFVVQGKVTHRNRPITGVMVKAFDKDLRSEELLGETVTDGQGLYKILYTAHQFRRGEKKSADLIVRAYSKEEVLLCEKGPIFNAKPSETLGLVVELPAVVKPSEYEKLVGVLTPLLEDSQPADLTKEDISFLLKELADELIVNRRRLQLLADSARLARETRLPTEAFYGLARQLQRKPPLDLKSFLLLTRSASKVALQAAIKKNIIPKSLQDSVDSILGRLEQLKIENRLLVQRPLTGRLLNEKTGKPLVNYRVRASHQHGEEPPKDLGVDITDRRGRFSLTLTTLSPTAAAEAERPVDRLSLSILNADNETIHQAELDVTPDQTELPDLKIPPEVLPKPAIRPVREVADSLRLELPAALTSLLTTHKIESIEDIRRAGGLRRLLEASTLSADSPAVKALEAQANLSLLKTSVTDNAHLVEKGFSSIGAIAAMPLKSFMAAVGEEIGRPKAVQVHAMARAQRKWLDSVATGIGVDIANGRVPMMWGTGTGGEIGVVEDPVLREVGGMFAAPCSCRDCEAAVSPAAYLADLLDYAVEHVKNGPGADDLITLEELANLLRQPFGDFPASCEALSKQVRQVRIAIEVLRRFVEPLLEKDQQAYCFSAYKVLLTKLGTSYEELRLARTADDDTRRALADRLGIDLPAGRPDPLDVMLLDPATITEEWLETLFGLADTTRDPLADGLTRGDSRQQISQWQLSGVGWMRNTDDMGLIYVRLSHPSGSVYRIDLYRNEARTQRVATGQINSAQGRVGLEERQYSGLTGTLALDFSRESDDIVLVAFPEVLNWRLQYLRTLWQAEDGITDPYTRRPISPYTEADLLPVIDPDLIGPDDFRTPFEKTEATDSDQPFDLWARRRRWVETRIDELRKLQKSINLEMGLDASHAWVLIAVLEHIFPEPPELPLPWPDSRRRVTGIANVFEILSENLAQGRDIENTKLRIRQRLKLTAESFLRLREIQAKALKERRLQKEDWDEVFSILAQVEKRRLFSEWRVQEQDMEGRMRHTIFGPRYFWSSLREPIEGPWPMELLKDLPFIDPEEVGLKELPEPTAGQRAIELWHRRREELTEAVEELKNQRDTESIHAMLGAALGDVPEGDDWQTYLAGLLDSARGEDPDVDDALENLHLDREQLARLLDVLAGTEVTEADWAEVYSLLASSWKKRVKWPEWHAEEQSDPVMSDPVSGKKDWRICKASLPKWRASVEDRQVWRQALKLRSRKPIIDPDLIGSDSIRDQTAGPARRLWRNRHRWIDDQIAEIERETAATPFARFDELLIDNLFEPRAVEGNEVRYRAIREASEGIDDFIRQALGVTRSDLENLLSDLDSPDPSVSGESLRNVTERFGLSVWAFRRLMNAVSDTPSDAAWNRIVTVLAPASLVAQFVSLDEEQEQGQDITERLVQLGLTNAAFSCLIRLRRLLASGAELHETEWADVYSIFLQVRKNRVAAEWLEDEQEATITLGPDHFQISEPLPLRFPPPEPEPLPAWRATQKDLRQWRNTLKARIEQAETTIADLQEAVSAVEEETLPALRNALIMTADVEGANLNVKAKRLIDLLLIDMQSGSCQMTTRISQAIETVQGVLWSIRTGQLQDTYADLALDAENFDEEWKWLGSYATWRAAMFVFLYPENILLPSLRREQTPAFGKLTDDLRMNRSLTAEGICSAAKEYADYFEDVCTLDIQSSCYGETGIHENDSCGTRASVVLPRNLFYMFATGGKTGKVYWSNLDPEDEVDYPQTFWEAVPCLENVQVTKIVGSAPYWKTKRQRFIFLFMQIAEEGKTKLLFTKYDLERGSWDSEPEELELPPLFFSILAVHSSIDTEPPKLAFHARYGEDVVYVRPLSKDCDGWEQPYTSEDEDGSGEGEWREYRTHGVFSDCNLHAVMECERDGGRYLFVCTNRIISTIDTPNVYIYYDQNEGSETGYIYQYRDNQLLDFAGVLPISSTGWCIYYKDNGGQLYQFSTDEEFVNTGTILQDPVDPISRLSRIVPHNGPSPERALLSAIIELKWQSSVYYKFLTYEWSESSFSQSFQYRINPLCPPLGTEDYFLNGSLPSPFDISTNISETELQQRSFLIRWITHENMGEATLMNTQIYLEEAFYFVHIQIAIQLHRHGHFTETLDWFRNVYDYRIPVARRKIGSMLRQEETVEFVGYRRSDGWLLDPLNPHQIALTRGKSETYTRFTILALVRCFLDYADAEFSLDTAESVPRARALYTTALELLETEVLQQRITPDCEEMIDQLEVEVGGELEGSASKYLPLWNFIISVLRESDTMETLSGTIGDINRTLSGDEPWITRLTRALDIVGGLPHSQPKTMEAVVTSRRGSVETAWELIYSRPMMAEMALKIDETAEKRFRHISWMLESESSMSELREVGPLELIGNSAGNYEYQPNLSFYFCIPPNPMLDVLRLRAELNLYKIRTCRNIAGIKRQLDPYAASSDIFSGMPQIGDRLRTNFSKTAILQPTHYRYQVLMERAMQLAQMAAQFEAAMLAAFEKRDAEAYHILKANHDVELTRQGVRLQELRVKEAKDGVDLTRLQRERAQIFVETYQEWLRAGLNMWEKAMINSYETAASSIRSEADSDDSGGTDATDRRALAELSASKAAVYANHERRKDEWELQKKIADQDIEIGKQQITLANDHVRVVSQEQKIAEMQADHAKEVVDFLANKFGNVELYDWMSDVLKGVYSFFLQQATAMAKLAENQVAFERQQIPPAYIQADYWEAPGDMVLGTSDQGNGQDRRGLTGSARLLEDIHQLDLYAFKTDQRKHQLSKTISLAQKAPAEFEQFRQTGVMLFETPTQLFDRDFPGHYLRLIKRVSTSVLALIPPTEGIHATLSTTGLSRVVIGNDGLFQQIDVRRYPESVALTSPINATGLFELLPQNQEMLLPFEAMGVDTFWEFRMLKAANRFDYRTLIDVLITLEYTALDDFAYHQQVIRELDDTISGDRPFSFRNDLPDQWYSLHHPEQTETPMAVRFDTRRADFPPNIEKLGIQHLLLYFVRSDGTIFEVPNVSLRLTEQGGAAPMGGTATTVEGLISTRSGSAGSWLAMTGKSPIGQWELALPNSAEVRNRFTNNEIENILFVITYTGTTPPWPE